MSRAQGKHPRRGSILDDIFDGPPREPSEGEQREEGIGDKVLLPGGKNHIANPPVPKFKVPVPEREWPYRRAILAHGVDPDEANMQPRDPRLSGGQHGAPVHEEVHRGPSPVPVYVVEHGGGPDKIRAAAPRSITCPASTTYEPARVCSINPRRIKIGILNEDTATDIRFATDLGALSAGTGALLPWPSNTYLWLETQAELFAIGATGSGTPKLSIIEVTEENAVA